MDRKISFAAAGGLGGWFIGIVISSLLGLNPFGFAGVLISLLTVAASAYTVFQRTALGQPEPAKQPYPPMPIFPKSGSGEHGTAGWENPELIDYHFNGGNFDSFIESEGFYIGEGLNVKPPMHAVCVAGSGQGKGVNIILPNLLKIPSASWFVLDPKGENARITARWQQEAGQNVIILDPWNEQKRLGATHGIEPTNFNPLAFARSNPDEMPESCGVIAEMLVPDNHQSKDDYWNSRARSLIKTYLLHLLTARPDHEQHLGTLYRWLRLPVNDRQTLWLDMHQNLTCDELVKSGIGEFLGLSEDSGPLPSIISTAQDNTVFLESSALRASLESNGFDPYDLTDGKTTLYLCLPERFIKSHARWLRLVVGVCLKACNYRPDQRVNFLLDEFAILGKMPDVERAFAFARGQNVCVWIFVQSLTQLMEIYGEHGANAFLSNARLRQFFGIYDLQTQKYISEYLGDMTITTTNSSQSTSTGDSTGNNSSSSPTGGSSGSSSGKSYSESTSTNKQKTARRLLTVEEVGKLDRIITLIDGRKYVLHRLPYWDSIFKAYGEGRYTMWSLNEEGWRNFIDDYRSGNWPFDLNTVFLPRADVVIRPSKS